MTATDPLTSTLICQARAGDESATRELLSRHQGRLRRMVSIHMDVRLAARIDASDVVQDVMLEASQKLSGYLHEPPIAFYPWLRQMAWQRLVHLRQHHLVTQKRSVLREHRWDVDLPDSSVVRLANRLVSNGSSPSQRAIREELRSRVQTALDAMQPRDRQVLILRYLEQLSALEASQVLGITEGAFTKRHLRAIQRIRRVLGNSSEDSG